MQDTQEIWVRSLDGEGPLEGEMATHCSFLAWEMPWTEELGRLQSMGSQKSGMSEHTQHSISPEQPAISL